MATAKRPRTSKSKRKTTQPAETAQVAKVTAKAVDIQDAIRARAYKLYQERGYEHGHDFEDWLRAEHEVRARFGISA
jgi:hypothetical protein